MEIEPTDGDSQPRHVAAAATRKVRAAQSTLSKLNDAWLRHGAAGHVTLEESRDLRQRTISFSVRVTDNSSVEEMEHLLRSCVSDARSALSNLVYAMAHENGADDAALQAADFPIMSRDTRRGGRDPKLRGVPIDAVERIWNVQPFAQSMPPHQAHPLELLRDLNNQDKHRQGLWVAPVLGPDGIHELAQMQIVMSPERAAALQRQQLDPNAFIDINPRPLSDGATVLRTRLPEGVDVESDVTVAALSVPLTLALVAPDPASDGYPLLRELGEALAFTRSIVWWVAGVTDTPPQPVRRWATHA